GPVATATRTATAPTGPCRDGGAAAPGAPQGCLGAARGADWAHRLPRVVQPHPRVHAGRARSPAGLRRLLERRVRPQGRRHRAAGTATRTGDAVVRPAAFHTRCARRAGRHHIPAAHGADGADLAGHAGAAAG
ncbi:unnamed protein product, partial [Phaeothamnion confervicola]